MVTAVQVAVVAAAAAWVIGVGVAVYLMLKAARLMSENATTVAALRERGDLLIDRANAAIDQAGEQIARTEAVTASVEGVTVTMSELDDHLIAAFGPTAPSEANVPGRPLTWAAALVYGIRWALLTRRTARQGPAPQPRRQASAWPGGEAGRRAALTGRANGSAR